MTQIYFDSISQIDGSPDTSSQILFSMATCLSEEEILKEKYDGLVKNKKVAKTTITPDKENLRNEISRRVALINKREGRDNLPS